MRGRTAALVGCGLLLLPALLSAQPVPVRHAEGLVHGFLVLRTLDGQTLADGDLLQTSRGDEVTSRLVFRFKDGSSFDETTVYGQRGTFRLRRDHTVQTGPAFPQPLESTIDVASGQVTVVATEDGAKKRYEQRERMPDDLANGLILTLLKNVGRLAAPRHASMYVFTPKPRRVGLEFSEEGEEPFVVGGTRDTAVRYRVKVDIGGITGTLATLLGKNPPDSRVWILPGNEPAFVKSESPFFAGAPLWRIELVSPTWPENAAPPSDRRQR